MVDISLILSDRESSITASMFESLKRYGVGLIVGWFVVADAEVGLFVVGLFVVGLFVVGLFVVGILVVGVAVVGILVVGLNVVGSFVVG